MTKLNVNFNKKTKNFKILINHNESLLNLDMVFVKSNLLTVEVYNFLFILRILSRCGFVKPLKRV